MAEDGETVETVTDFIFWGSKITAPKLTWTFQLRASQGHDQPSLPGIEMTWLRVCLHHLTGELDEGKEPLFFL